MRQERIGSGFLGIEEDRQPILYNSQMPSSAVGRYVGSTRSKMFVFVEVI